MAAFSNNAESPATKLWSCSDRACNTSQTYEERSIFGRKVVSDHFGRNKTATRAIDDDVWHWQCRKGYQRAKYAADNGTANEQMTFYMSHLRAQVTRISLWRPQARFSIQLSKPSKSRLEQWHAILRGNGGDIAEANKRLDVVAKTGKKGKAVGLNLADAVQPVHADHIQTHFVGDDKSIDYIVNTVFPWIEQEFRSGSMARMPPIEFLINDPQPGETITDPKTNYDRWTAVQDGVSYVGDSEVMVDKGRKRKAEDDDEGNRSCKKYKTASSPPPKSDHLEDSPSPSQRKILKLRLRNPAYKKRHGASESISPTTKPQSPKLFLRNPDFSSSPSLDNTPDLADDASSATSSDKESPDTPTMQQTALNLLALGRRTWRNPFVGSESAENELPLFVTPASIVRQGSHTSESEAALRAGIAAGGEEDYDEESESESETDDDDDDEAVFRGPIYARHRMVYAGAKGKKVDGC